MRAENIAFAELPRNHFGAILADPPWRFRTWAGTDDFVKPWSNPQAAHYPTLWITQLHSLPVQQLAARDCALFLWTTWDHLPNALRLLEAWGFRYSTCAFDWMKTTKDGRVRMGRGYWARLSTEPCLLATRGSPKRLDKSVPQGIIEPRREHSRKPSCVYERIERLVAGPYLELFARQHRNGWTSWGNEVSGAPFAEQDSVRERVGEQEP